MKIRYDGHGYAWQCDNCKSYGFSVNMPPKETICGVCGETIKLTTVDAAEFLKGFRETRNLSKTMFSYKYAAKLGRAERTIQGWERRTISRAAFALLLKVL